MFPRSGVCLCDLTGLRYIYIYIYVYILLLSRHALLWVVHDVICFDFRCALVHFAVRESRGLLGFLRYIGMPILT